MFLPIIMMIMVYFYLGFQILNLPSSWGVRACCWPLCFEALVWEPPLDLQSLAYTSPCSRITTLAAASLPHYHYLAQLPEFTMQKSVFHKPIKTQHIFICLHTSCERNLSEELYRSYSFINQVTLQIPTLLKMLNYKMHATNYAHSNELPDLTWSLKYLSAIK